ncbi:MAG: ribonucleotide reductase N-terminal alpha domain-containing protein, partial [Acidithiobacillus sp.]|uniref:ribonucleotide reductase N-terminal alpha domain-containing protein n=1 Tax=Acidithiobacillus sp. TaxID=1872118 RepID=UPI00356123C6
VSINNIARKTLSETAEKILKNRYYLRDENGNVKEDWYDLCMRISERVAREESDSSNKELFQNKFFNMMYNLECIPNSPALKNTGDHNTASSFACYVFHIKDDLRDIFQVLAKTAEIQKYGGGTGYDFSALRPSGSEIKGANGITNGPLSFMKIFDLAIGRIIQQGGLRPGAQMGTLNIYHPDIIDFIRSKRKTGELTCFNISVTIDDNFMEILNSDSSRIFKAHHEFFGDEVFFVFEKETLKRHKFNKNDDYIKNKYISYLDLWNIIIENAWEEGDPGLQFIDEINRFNPIPSNKLITTNPCVVGDSLVAVADGRNIVSIKQLAEENKDVPVYCCDPKTGEIVIRKGSQFRKTRENVEVWKVTLDDNSSIIATPDHKFLLWGGISKELKDLKSSDQLISFKITYQENKEQLVESRMNHKVVSIEFYGYEDVYNCNVDEHHTVAYVTSVEKRIIGKKKPREVLSCLSGINIKNCGESSLYDRESCVLASLSLPKFIIRNREIIENNDIDEQLLLEESLKCFNFIKFKDVIETSTRFLDNLIDANNFTLKEIEEATKASRKIGIGFMGWADMLIMLKIPYNSDIAFKLAEIISEFVQNTSMNYSIELAKEKGKFPLFNKSKFDYKNVEEYRFHYKNVEGSRCDWKYTEEQLKLYGIRNSTLMVQAPTGTISRIANVSFGIEPLYKLAFLSAIMKMQNEKDILFINENFINELKKLHLDNDEDIIDEIQETGSCQDIDELDEDLRLIFLTASDIKFNDHIKMQSSFQKWFCNNISKTINMSSSSTISDVDNAYRMSYNLKCRGTTIFRDGCKDYLGGQVLKSVKNKKDNFYITPLKRKRPKITSGSMEKINTSLGKLFIYIGEDEYGICEVVAMLGKTGSENSAFVEALGRTVSIALQNNVEIKEIITQLRGITSNPVRDNTDMISSVAEGIAIAIERYCNRKNVILNISQ